jgi:hypothetical protein
MKSRIHLNCREIVGIKFQPATFWQIRRVENVTPVFKTPRARPDAYLVLIGQVQNEIATLASLLSLEKGYFRKCGEYFKGALAATET